MIGSLKGIVEIIDASFVLIDVNGVGYKVLVSSSLLSKLRIGDLIKLFTHTHVREDVLDLYGFLEILDLKLFELLISVSGVGPKTALGIFSVGPQEEIIKAITTGNTEFFTGVPRLGKKNAQKIIIELKSKLGSVTDFDLNSLGGGENKEVFDALKNFGFSAKEVREAIKNIKAKGATVEEKVKLALKQLGK